MTKQSAGVGAATEAAGRQLPNAQVPFLLKAAVIGMGLMLVAGLVVVFSTIMYRTVKPGADSPARNGSPAALVRELALDIPERAVRDIALDGGRLAVRTDTEIIVIDFRRGVVVSRIRFKPAP